MKEINCYQLPSALVDKHPAYDNVYVAHLAVPSGYRTLLVGNRAVCWRLPKIHFFFWQRKSRFASASLMIFFEIDGKFLFTHLPHCMGGIVCLSNMVYADNYRKKPFVEQFESCISYFWTSYFNMTIESCALDGSVIPAEANYMWARALGRLTAGELENYRVETVPCEN